MDPVQGEVTRSYILHLPASYSPANTAATPLLLDYHGYTASANLQLLLFPWRQVADRDETGGVECQRRPHNLIIISTCQGLSTWPWTGCRTCRRAAAGTAAGTALEALDPWAPPATSP